MRDPKGQTVGDLFPGIFDDEDSGDLPTAEEVEEMQREITEMNLKLKNKE